MKTVKRTDKSKQEQAIGAEDPAEIEGDSESGLKQPSGKSSATNGNGAHTAHGKPDIMATFQNSEDAPPCTGCGSSMMVRQAGCYVCLNCGAQGGCG